MAIKFACPSCGRALRARDEFAGKRAECPFCGAMSLVPQGAPEPIQAELVTPPPVATTEIRQFFDAPTSTPKDERPKTAISLRHDVRGPARSAQHPMDVDARRRLVRAGLDCLADQLGRLREQTGSRRGLGNWQPGHPGRRLVGLPENTFSDRRPGVDVPGLHRGAVELVVLRPCGSGQLG